MKNHIRLTARILAALPLIAMASASLAHGSADADNLQAFAATLPGVIARSSNEEKLLKTPDGKGNEVIVARTTRAPGTRTPLHTHDHGGITCVLEGEMSLYQPGIAPQRAVAGQCYYMPANRVMAGINTGTTNAVMLDIFTAPQGSPVWSVVEESGKALQNQFDQHEH